MALRFVDGFDFWTTRPGCWTSTAADNSNHVSVASSKLTVPTGVGNLNVSYIRTTLPGSYGTVIVNLRMTFGSNGDFVDAPFIHFYNGNTVQVTIGTNSAGQFWVKRGAYNGTQVGTYSTAAVVMDNTTEYDVEIKLLAADSGTCEIRLNGATVLSVAGDLNNGGAQLVDNILCGRNVSGGTGALAYPGMKFEHVIIMDTTGTSMNDFIGPVKVNPHYLTADGTYTDFTANAGSRWDAINDLDPDGDTTYISANTVGNKYTAVASNLPAGITTVHALAVWANSKRDDDVARAYKALLRYAAADQLGSADKYVGPNYAYQLSTFDVSPFTDVAWTTTEVNGLEVGVQITV